MITYSSYNPPTFPVISNVLTVACCNSGTELFAGLCVFSILGYLAEQRGVGIEEVVQAGPGLVFEVIPEALALMPSKQLFSFLFFLMLLLLGLTSAVSLVEASIAVVRDMLSLAIRKLESPSCSFHQFGTRHPFFTSSGMPLYLKSSHFRTKRPGLNVFHPFKVYLNLVLCIRFSVKRIIHNKS